MRAAALGPSVELPDQGVEVSPDQPAEVRPIVTKDGFGRVPQPLPGWHQYLVELLGSGAREEFGRRVGLVGRFDQKRGCGDLGSVWGEV